MRAFLWTPSSGMRDLGTLPGDQESEALNINDAGEAVGWSSAPNRIRAVLWSVAGIQDLGALGAGQYNKARAINAHGEVVGYSGDVHASRAFLWTRGSGMQDLNALLVPPASGLVLTEAAGINNAGWILAIGRDHHHGHVESKHQDGHEAPLRVFLLVPVR